MAGGRVHFELFVRRYPDSDWKLDMASEVRSAVIDMAKDRIARGEVVAARVAKETLDEETGEFNSLNILTLGAPEKRSKPKPPESTEPLCITPQDLYTVHARDRIGRLLEDWLDRRGATPFELLHRPDLVEQLEASGVEIAHAVHQIAMPEAFARGTTVAAMTANFKSLAERAIERLMKDRARRVLPHVTVETFAKVAGQMAKDPEGAYLLGCGVAGCLAAAGSWSEKVSLLLDLADAAPQPSAGRILALSVLNQCLAEIVGSRKGLDDILGGGLDLGGGLAAMTRLCAADVIDKLVEIEASVAKVMPALSPRAQRLAKWLGTDDFTDVRASIGLRVLRELNGPRRLRPADAAGEIDVLRGLAMALTAAAGKLLPIDDVQAAFSARSRMLVTRHFVEVYLGHDRAAYDEAHALVWLTENIVGGGNKREAGRWLNTLICSIRFEREFRQSPQPIATRLTGLARLQRAVSRCGLVAEDFGPIQARLGELGALIEADSRMIALTLAADAPALSRLTVLLKMACGETAPLGPAADRARVEALKFARSESIRSALASAPEQVDAIRDLLQHASTAVAA
jgi:hypothetical protein